MKYVARPVVVDAFVIVSMSQRPEALTLKCDDGKERVPFPSMLARIDPQIGDYWVIQSDGYCYLNPREVFERKYAPMPEAT